MLIGLICLVMVRVFGWLVVLARSDAVKDAQILVLRRQIAIVRRHPARPEPGWADRAVIAAVAGLPGHLPVRTAERDDVVWHTSRMQACAAAHDGCGKPGENGGGAGPLGLCVGTLCPTDAPVRR